MTEPIDAREGEAARPLSPEVVRALVAHRRRFLAFLEGRVGSAAQAEELLQAALLRTWERGAPLDEEGAVQWVFRLLRNAAIDLHRRRLAERRALHAEEPEEPRWEPELRGELCACLAELLPTLKPAYARVLRLVDLEEQALPEVAVRLGISRNNAGVRLHRARQALKRQLERSCGACATHGCLDCECGGPVAKLDVRRDG
jgi:RNA polymerase sigma factor (sigma-70 family)